MSRTRFIEHEGRPIVFMDFSNLDVPPEALKAISEARQFVAQQPKVQNLLVIVLVEGAHFNDDVMKALRELAEHDRPWVLASAVVGLSPLQRILYRLVVTFTGRKLATFKTVDEAKAWLVAQKVPPASVPDSA